VALTQATLLELVGRLANDLDDRVDLTATSDGTATTFLDNVNINSMARSYDGWEFWGTSAPNANVIATVTATASATITLTPAMTSTTTGNTAMLVNKLGRGFRIQEYKRAINAAINDFNGVARIETIETISPVYDYETQTIAVPATLAEVYKVEWQDSEGTWNEIRRATPKGGYGWTAEPSAAVIRIEGNAAYAADGYSVRLHGYKFQAELSAQSDLCYFEPGGVVARAAYYLCKGAIGSRDARFGQQALLYKEESETMMRRAKVTRQPGTTKVRT
jgi:hypothetical protein